MIRVIFIIGVFVLWAFRASSQFVTSCPQNIGFESNTFNNWELKYGLISQTSDRTPDVGRPPTLSLIDANVFYSQQHVRLRSDATERDPYGLFPLKSPNGSEYFLKLGNDLTGRGAARISYTFNVPADVDNYSIVFNYAVVFDNPGHSPDEQPKFTAKVFDLTTGTSTECGSFEFVSDGDLPDFRYSSVDFEVLYKPWSPVLVNLNDYRGHTIRMEFTTNDCSRGGHFGYAYLDFDENCSIPILGNVVCPEINSTTLKTLPGFFSYRWFNAETDQFLGDRESVVLSPTPAPGTRVGIELFPYPGLGCTQTLYTTIGGIEMYITDPQPDCFRVDLTDMSLKVGSSSDLNYSYYYDAQARLPIDDPESITETGTYYIKGRSSSGCEKILPVNVLIIVVPPLVVTSSLETTYPGTIDLSSTFIHGNGLEYSFWADARAEIPLQNFQAVGRQGTYFVKTTTAEGCFNITPLSIRIIIPDIVIPSGFTPNGDGVNDLLTVLLSTEVKVNYFRIFNRWGDVVYTTKDYESSWDGFKNNSEVPPGVYYWALEGIKNDEKYFRSGYLTLLR